MSDKDFATEACDGLLQRLDALLVLLASLRQRREDQRAPMPDAWLQRALPNLERLRTEVLDARQAAGRQELRPAVEICAQMAGLGRDLDWATDWMGPAAQTEFEALREALVLWASGHHREGYRRLTSPAA